MSDLMELLERVRKADAPDRELDAAIDVFLFGGETVWKQANYTMETYPSSKRASTNHVGGFAFEAVPNYTSYIDASLGAVMQKCPGWAWKLVHEEGRFTFVLRDAPTLERVALSAVASNEAAGVAIVTALLTAQHRAGASS